MPKLLTILIALALLATAVLGATTSSARTRPRTKVVLVKDDVFKPGRITIRKGSYVKWEWKGSNPHNVHVGKSHSKTQIHGTYRLRFKKPGTYRVFCSLHVDLGMTMKIKVTR